MPAHQYALKNFRDLLAAYVGYCNTYGAKKEKSLHAIELEHLLPLLLGIDGLLPKAPDAKASDEAKQQAADSKAPDEAKQQAADSKAPDEAKQLIALEALLNTAKGASETFHLTHIRPKHASSVWEDTDDLPHSPLNFTNPYFFNDGVKHGSGTYGHQIIYMCRNALANGLLYIKDVKKADVYPIANIQRIANRIDEAMQPIAKFLKLQWANLIPEAHWMDTLVNFFKSTKDKDATPQNANAGAKPASATLRADTPAPRLSKDNTSLN